MQKYRNLKQKIILYVMSVSILVAVLITTIMAVGSVRSTNAILLDNMQITARIAAQNISSNLHLLTERMYNFSQEPLLLDAAAPAEEKQAYLDAAKLQIEFVWLSAYDNPVRSFTATPAHRTQSQIRITTPCWLPQPQSSFRYPGEFPTLSPMQLPA